MTNGNPLSRRNKPSTSSAPAEPTLGNVYKDHQPAKASKQKVTVEISEEAYLTLLMLKGRTRTPMGELVTSAVMKTYGTTEDHS
ncbi:hypothetical protein [Rothia uropygialis]|uniref:hypothetical protein n=1 Tax=Kocuria sp. 36 TaxID=1415402 RepID=UPI00101D0AD1|nr:hypothetical protein [Kocuria sp. 36]